MRLSFDLSVNWGAFQLAAKADLQMSGVTALFGPSGAGKSSVMGAIAGFHPDLGLVQFDGDLWQGPGRAVPVHKRPVGMVFQDGRLFDHLSVAGNLAYAAKRADPDGPAVAETDAISALGLEDLLDRRPPTLSGGERQRVAIARALLTRPRLMLMDEPLAALDRARKAGLLAMIADLPSRFDLPVIYVSHQLDEIVQIADRLVTMKAGQVTGQGAVPEMVARMDPALTGRFEAGVVLEGPVVELRRQYAMAAVEIAGAKLWMPDVGGAALGERLRVRIRARDVSLALGEVEGLSIRNRIPVTVDAIETDDGAFAEVSLSAGGQPLQARVSRMALEELGLVEGSQALALIKSIAFDRRLSRGEP